MPAAIASRGDFSCSSLAVELDPAGRDRVGREHGAGQLRASRADQAREAEDLAGAHVERAVLQYARRA